MSLTLLVTQRCRPARRAGHAWFVGVDKGMPCRCLDFKYEDQLHNTAVGIGVSRAAIAATLGQCCVGRFALLASAKHWIDTNRPHHPAPFVPAPNADPDDRQLEAAYRSLGAAMYQAIAAGVRVGGQLATFFTKQLAEAASSAACLETADLLELDIGTHGRLHTLDQLAAAGSEDDYLAAAELEAEYLRDDHLLPADFQPSVASHDLLQHAFLKCAVCGVLHRLNVPCDAVFVWSANLKRNSRCNRRWPLKTEHVQLLSAGATCRRPSPPPSSGSRQASFPQHRASPCSTMP